MKKSLLTLTGAIACILTGNAFDGISFAEGNTESVNKFYPLDEYGEVSGISDNGKYAVASDSDDNLSYLWSEESPSEFKLVNNFVLMDVTDDGMYVGSRYQGGRYLPCVYYANGDYKELPLAPNTLNTNMAVAVSNDGKFIGGYLYTFASDIATGGRYYPAIWTLNDAGEYDLTCYNDLNLGDQQGFYITSMSNDGRCLAGSLFYGFSAQLTACLVDGKLKLFNDLEVKMEPWYYKDKYMGDEPVYYIDGFADKRSDHTYMGLFLSNDNQGNFYGTQTISYDVQEDGSGELKQLGCIYNYLTDTWTYSDDSINCYNCGIDGKYVFTNSNDVVADGKAEEVANYFNLDLGGLESAGITAISADGRVIGGCTRKFFEAIMEYNYFPYMIVLDKPLLDNVGAPELFVAENGDAVVVSKGRVDFTGTEGSVYDLNGRLVGAGSSVELNSGLYIVCQGKNARKVAVK